MNSSLILCALALWSPFFKKAIPEEAPAVVKLENGKKPQINTIEFSDLKDVYMLTYDAYLAMGYAVPNVSGLLIHYPYFDHLPETTILTITINKKIIASASYTLDGPMGLTMDDDFKREIDLERALGRKVAGVWRLVVQEEHRKDQRVILSLLRKVVEDLLRHGVDTLFISVHPKHVKIYKRTVGMEVVATKQMQNPIMEAPEVLMRGRKEDLPQRWYLSLFWIIPFAWMVDMRNYLMELPWSHIFWIAFQVLGIWFVVSVAFCLIVWPRLVRFLRDIEDDD